MKDDWAYLCHIRDAIARIEQYSAGGKEEFLAGSHWQDAIIRQLEIIGEASKRLSPAVRENSPEIPWRRICGLRDILIHNYMGVDVEAIWAIVEDSVPVLKATIESLVKSAQATKPSDADRRDVK